MKLIFIIGSLMITLVAFSRVYLGVHYFGDVVAGIGLGVVTVLLFIFIDPKISALISSRTFEQKLVMATVPVLFLVMIGAFNFGINDNGVRLSGALWGLFIGYIFEGEFLRFTMAVSTKLKVQRFVIGIFISFILYFGLGAVLPYNIGTALFLAWLGGFSVMFISPLIFDKIERLETYWLWSY
jgi:hypothetical protein